MDVGFTKDDIIEHVTSQEQRFSDWRDEIMPYTQGKAFFFSDPDHADLATTVAELTAQSHASPTVQGFTF